jgi:hypothetical protein
VREIERGSCAIACDGGARGTREGREKGEGARGREGREGEGGEGKSYEISGNVKV